MKEAANYVRDGDTHDPVLSYTVQLNRDGVVIFKTIVRAKPAGIVGDWHEGTPYQPDREQTRAALPFHYRPAFDRAMVWWQEESMSGRLMPLSCPLKNVKGQPIGTLYATPNWVAMPGAKTDG